MKKLSELVIGKKDVMVKERIAFTVESPGPKQFVIQYPLPIKVAKGRDKFGKIKTQINNSNQITIQIHRDLKPSTVHAVELTILVIPDIELIGTIQVFHWGSLDLSRIVSLIKPFQILGFGNMSRKNGQWIYNKNLTFDIRNNLVRFRSTRVELGEWQDIRVRLEFSIDCRLGGRVKFLRFFGPTTSKRQQTHLLTNGVDIIHDEDGNPKYHNSIGVDPGEMRQFITDWRVQIKNGFNPTTNLGSMRALKILIKENPKFKKYLQPSTYWEVNHPDIQKIIQRLNSKSSIFNTHRLLFEFVNRQLAYTITEDRRTAVTALQNGFGDCSEFADLLVTLHRAVGIPSRVVEGIIIENDKRLNPEGHAYVEFLTTKGWTPCDPTWGIVLGVTSQHIEFTHQRTKSKVSKIFSLQYSGPKPVVNYQISWSPID